MKTLFFVCAICLQLQWSYGKPDGVGAYAYQDSAGNRYGGTYGLKDGQVYGKDIDDSTTFGPNPFTNFQDIDSFFPEFFRNLDSCLQEVFAKNADQHKKALNAARKAFDLTSNNAGYVPNFDTDFNRFPGFPTFDIPQPDFMGGFGGFPNFANFPPAMPNLNSFAENSAFAGGAVAPGYRHQVVALSPANPNKPNIDVKKLSETNRGAGPQFYSVQSSSFVTSSNVDGKQQTNKGGETIVNENGKITKYSLND
ncbi:hypothetical protein NE865_07789 [Phthorimaea operculella]|nr:hypothetical protein NE865_07789 [Phthorimaea operculella]